MVLILMLFFVIISFVILILKRDLEALYVTGMTLSLASMVTGVFIYIAKKGGLRSEAIEFFFINDPIRIFLQYYLITLDDLGFMMAVGRILFPMFFLYAALRYSRRYMEKPWRLMNQLLWVPPLLSLAGYYPKIFTSFIGSHVVLEPLLVYFTFGWIIAYIGFGFYFLFYELRNIRLKNFQRGFTIIIIFFISITSIYLLYFIQDPIQVYQFYSMNVYWINDIYYMTSILPVSVYYVIIGLNILFSVLGFYSIWRYTNIIFVGGQQQIIIEKKMEAVNDGTSMFVHSIKNQLLANRVLMKRLHGNVIQKEQEKAETVLGQLQEQNEHLLERMEALYATVKSKAISLVPVKVLVIVNQAITLSSNKYPVHFVKTDIPADAVIFADYKYLSEAIYNLIINAQEAIEKKGIVNGEISIRCYQEKNETIIEIKDNGMGIHKADQKQIMDPYFSNKNSNYNWGMGLYYVHSIIKDHFGSLKYESESGRGSTFYVILPKYKRKRSDEK